MSGNSRCLSGLVGKRAGLAGEIRLLKERLEQLRSDVPHVDAAIRIISLAFKIDGGVLPKVRRPRRDRFGNGDGRCAALAASRAA